MLGMGPHSGSIHHKQNVTLIIIKQKDEPSLKRGNEVDQNSDEVEHFRVISYKSQAVKLICFNQLSQEKIKEDSLAIADNSLQEKQ